MRRAEFKREEEGFVCEQLSVCQLLHLYIKLVYLTEKSKIPV